MKIYTKTGDKGKTSLIGGERVLKSDLRLESYGTADELNSFIGLLLSKVTNEAYPYGDILLHIQNKLFGLGAFLADPTAAISEKTEWISEEDTRQMEEDIDNLSKDLPPLRGFILPSGNEQVALCHICRTITRRLERSMVRLFEEKEGDMMTPKEEKCLHYVNRLSDFFFVLSRHVGQNDGCSVFLWKK